MRTLCKKLVSCRRAIPESRVSPCRKMPLKHRASGICKYLPGFRNKYFLNLKTRPRPVRSGAGLAIRRFRSRGHDSQKKPTPENIRRRHRACYYPTRFFLRTFGFL